jgi:hypothetical protein
MTTKNPGPVYPNLKPWDLEPHYTKHVGAMTEEGLHSKSAIAEQLAWRDKTIERLKRSDRLSAVALCLGCRKPFTSPDHDQRCSSCAESGTGPEPEGQPQNRAAALSTAEREVVEKAVAWNNCDRRLDIERTELDLAVACDELLVLRAQEAEG